MTEATRSAGRVKFSHSHWLVLGILLVISGIVLSLHTDEAAATRTDAIDASSGSWNQTLPWTLPPTDDRSTESDDDAADTPGEWRTVKIKYGDNLSAIFARLGLSPQLLYSIMTLGGETAVLKNILPGQTIKLKLADKSRLTELLYDMDPTAPCASGKPVPTVSRAP